MFVQPCLHGGFLAALAQIICFSTADGNADREHREEMLAKDSDGLASSLLYARRLICILGAGQIADGVSREAVLSFAGFRSGMQSLVPVNLRTFDQRYLEKARVGSALSAQWLPGCSGANYLHFVMLAECKYVTEGSQLVFLSERTERKRNHLHLASGSKCRWNDQMQEITVMNCHLLFASS